MVEAEVKVPGYTDEDCQIDQLVVGLAIKY
jgi:hypothetical protein